MKRFLPVQKKPETLKLKSTYFIYSLFVSCLLILSVVVVKAQDNSVIEIMEVESFIASLESSESSKPEALQLDNLLHNLNPSVYVEHENINIYGNRPVNLIVNISSLSELNNPDIPKNNIEIISIKIENTSNLNSIIDLSTLSNYYKLKYIYILSLVPVSEEDISNMILNNDKEYSIFYKIDKGESNQ